MGGTNKAIFYAKCCELSTDKNKYKGMYQKTSLDFWIREYKFYVYQRIHKSEVIKIHLGNRVPLDMYFKIMGYLNLNNFV